MFEKLKKSAPVAAIGMMLLALAACNTVEGAGKDIEAAGSAIEKAASDNK